MMYGLYGNEFLRGQRTGPGTTLVFGAAEQSSLLAWHELLMAEAGCFFSQTVDMNIPLPHAVRSWEPLTPPPPEVVCLFSDAAAEGDFRSIGGYSQGEYWSLQLPREVQLHITALELRSFCVNTLVFAHRRRIGMGRLYLSRRLINCVYFRRTTHLLRINAGYPSCLRHVPDVRQHYYRQLGGPCQRRKQSAR